MKKGSKYFKQSKFNPVIFQKKLEESQVKIDRMKISFDHKYQALENFLTLIVNFASHDIKNSLHSLDGMVSTIAPPVIGKQEVNDMKMCIDQMRDILVTFGDFSIKNKDNSFEIGHLFQSLQILHRPYVKKDKVEFSIDYINFDKSLVLHQDFQLILYMFNNMIINSLTALKDSLNKRIKIILTKENEGIEVLVCDTGIGIIPENISKVFEAYFTTKESGTGVGLTHVRYVVEEIMNSQIVILDTQIEDFITIFKLIIPINSNDTQNIDN